jgi:riboflavin synthase
MFTGIITHIGTIRDITKTQNSVIFEIGVDQGFLEDLKIGDSISHNGACLTAIEIEKYSYKVQLIPETLDKTAFGDSSTGDKVNLEKAMILGTRLDGHIVQGHVDGVGIVDKITIDDHSWVIAVSTPKELIKYIAYKGSICINGVSLTVSKRTESQFEVSLITHTAENTNLGELKEGNKVNLEIDVIARYVENMITK